MRIAFIVTAITNSGPENVVHDLTEVFQSHGHYCKVYYFDALREDRPNISFSCDTEIISLSSKINTEEYDVVHAHGIRPNLYVSLHKPLRKSKTKYVSTFHNFLFRDYRMNYGVLKGYLGGIVFLLSSIRFDKLIALNKSALEYYKTWFEDSKLTYAYNSRVVERNEDISDEHKEIIRQLRDKYQYICCSICGLSDRKGLDQIINAIKELKNVCFIIIGDGPARKRLMELAESINIEERVIFFGLQQKGYRYLPYIDVFCIPSYTEGFPLAMLEASAYRKAIVSSDIEVFKEIFDDTEVVKFKLGSIKDCQQAISKACSKLYEYGERAYKHYEKEYSPECFYQRHLDIYEGRI